VPVTQKSGISSDVSESLAHFSLSFAHLKNHQEGRLLNQGCAHRFNIGGQIMMGTTTYLVALFA
jgi:hypothetical protein